ncbi:uncharacterized protein LOC109859996 isoform X2 [Pseudomyrmex gracilis]|uniref:uncharacterized protein LOC109859996 isoform X2 n=1 Tax=Pseudomyrmex gracilis TaxID=219809 RepID=UPI000995D7AA|nr:uncharacterized protein LOC109859996 isoform X2 [Pseudomyrmex gracilis]
MGRQCSVSGCLNKQLKVKKVTFFKAPKSIDTRNKWSRLLGCLLTENSYICEQHFHSSDIKSAETVNDAAGNVLYNYQFKKKILLKDALPFKHNNSSIDEHKDVATKMITLDSNEKTESELCNENMNCHTESYNEIEMEQTVMNCQEESSKSNLINLIKEIEIKQTVNSCITSDEIEDSLYDKIIKQEVVIKFPRSEWGVHCCLRKKLLVFSVIEIMPDSCSGNVMIPIYTKQK